MKHPNYPGVSSFTDNRGATRWRFRKSGLPTVYLPGEPGSDEFDAAYEAAIEGRAKAQRRYRENPQGVRGSFPRRIETMLAQKKLQARSLGREFDLDEEWFVAELNRTDYRCAVTGISFQADRADSVRVNPFAPSVDRIDCSRGYTKDNVRLVLVSVNVALSDFGLDHFDQIVAARMQRLVHERIPA